MPKEMRPASSQTSEEPGYKCARPIETAETVTSFGGPFSRYITPANKGLTPILKQTMIRGKKTIGAAIN
jgi:hypothetical protein